jgi:hypothetical protein
MISPSRGLHRDQPPPTVGERLNLKVHLASQSRIEMTADVVRVLEKEEARRLQHRAGFAVRGSRILREILAPRCA